jgi:hypothetical protein
MAYPINDAAGGGLAVAEANGAVDAAAAGAGAGAEAKGAVDASAAAAAVWAVDAQKTLDAYPRC